MSNLPERATLEESLHMADNAFEILLEALRFADDAVAHGEGIGLMSYCRNYEPNHPSVKILSEFLKG